MALEPLKIDIEVNKANFEKQLKNSEQFARDTKKKIDQNMKFQLEFNIANFQTKLAQVKSQLKTATGNNKINLQIEANQLQRGLTEAKRNLNNLVNTGDKTLSRLQQKFNGLGGAINYVKIGIASFVANLASSALNSFTNFLKSSVNEAIAGQRALAQLEAVLKSTGNTSGLTGEQVKNMATELSELNGIEDDVVMSAQNMLLTFTNIKSNIFPETTQAVIDLATAMNGGLIPSSEELRNTSIQVGKALNDPLKGITKLTKIGVTFSKQQKEQIENFVRAGDVASAQRIILEELNKEFGGSAQAQLQTYAGKVAQLSVKRANFKETIGNVLIPALSKVLDLLMKISSFMGSVNNGSFFDKTLGKIPGVQEVRKKIQALPFVQKLNAPIGGPVVQAPTTKTLTSSQQAEAKKILAGDYGGISTGGGGGGGISATQKAFDELKSSFKSAFDSINSDIDKSKGKLEDYKKTVQDLTKDLEDLATERDKDIASRVAEIDTLLAKQGEEAILAEERALLEAERKEAFSGLNQEQIDALNKQIQDIKDYNALTDIGKIKKDYDIKKAQIDEEIALTNMKIQNEEEALKGLQEVKLQLERDYTNQFKGMIEEQKTAVDGLIKKYAELVTIKQNAIGGGGVANASTTNNTQNNTFNVTNMTMAEYLSRSLSQ